MVLLRQLFATTGSLKLPTSSMCIKCGLFSCVYLVPKPRVLGSLQAAELLWDAFAADPRTAAAAERMQVWCCEKTAKPA